MDIGWYKENKALQAELRREYQAVAELIDELEQQLSRYQGAVEVEGKVYYSGDYCWVESDIFPEGYELPNGIRVKLLVLKEVE